MSSNIPFISTPRFPEIATPPHPQTSCVAPWGSVEMWCFPDFFAARTISLRRTLWDRLVGLGVGVERQRAVPNRCVETLQHLFERGFPSHQTAWLKETLLSRQTNG